jgi:LmbE family N-acetylglucosaminyl deacetylase
VLRFNFQIESTTPLKLLCLGAHSDDIEIGCGGTILRLIEEFPSLEIVWVVFSALGERSDEAIKSAEAFLRNVPEKQIITKQFRDGYFPSNVSTIKDVFEVLKKDYSPGLIFTHFRHDLHQDHRQICELTWNTWREHLILEYEIPKYDGDLQSPNFFVNISDKYREMKIDLLMKHFQTQSNKHWFSAETFNAILRLRGIECKATDGYAEAFYNRKLLY